MREPMTLRKLIEAHRQRDGNDDFMDLPMQFRITDGYRTNSAHDDMKADMWPNTFRPFADYAGALSFEVYTHGHRLVKVKQK